MGERMSMGCFSLDCFAGHEVVLDSGVWHLLDRGHLLISREQACQAILYLLLGVTFCCLVQEHR